jgi:putative transposase
MQSWRSDKNGRPIIPDAPEMPLVAGYAFGYRDSAFWGMVALQARCKNPVKHFTGRIMSVYPTSTLYFLTQYAYDKAPLFAEAADKRLLIAKMLETKKVFHLDIAAYVILDNHMHWLISSPQSNGVTAVINHFRGAVQRDWRKAMPEREEAKIWSSASRLTTLHGSVELRNHMDFIHYDAVRHGLVSRATDYPWSSLPLRVEQGRYPERWGEVAPPAAVARVVSAYKHRASSLSSNGIFDETLDETHVETPLQEA